MYLFFSVFSSRPLMCTLFARIGDSAKNAFHSNPTNTVFDAKRLIGRKMHDDDLKRDMKHWPFSVKEKGGKPVITVRYQSENREFVGFFFSPCEFTRVLC